MVCDAVIALANIGDFIIDNTVVTWQTADRHLSTLLAPARTRD
ncbi:hypothetical protein [Amycolatopsis mediterranei]|uniref:Uncharacterized protein n=1 Tax=Amycolatopsis mediterranei (strain S699) TaxID=713604 RepID=A0A9R0UAW1_AMYMS|nr:hypothetical protein [Amycolatopsis mediterranei]AEK44394.1 hypothetical protein RAM_29595 [Amycolatopsis mediterranei S699]